MRQSSTGTRWLLPALLAVAVCALPAYAAQRVVVGEEFTNPS